jgi:hypothetical protein
MIKDGVEAQMAIVNTTMVPIEPILFSEVIMPDGRMPDERVPDAQCVLPLVGTAK